MSASKPNTWVNRKVAAKTQVAALTAGPTVTYSANSASAATGAVAVANGNSVTNAELHRYCVELKAKVDAITAALQA